MKPDDPEVLARVLEAIDDDLPPLLEVADRLADTTDVSTSVATDAVEAAIDDGILVEEDVGAFGGLRLADDAVETAEPSKADESGPEDTGKADANPGSEAPKPAEDGAALDESAGYADMFRRAQAIAGRERWEYVEEAALREALTEAGYVDLLERGELPRMSDWQHVDFADEGEEPDRRYYYAPAAPEPRPAELRRFHDRLVAEAPDGYEPYYFRVERAGKAPDTKYGSWKDDDNRLSIDEAVEHMEGGGNIGVAGTPEDALVNVDIDDDEETTPDDVPTSLRARSRSRTGWHTWYFNPDGDVPNIPTDEYGEIRTDWQYVVAPGSFVASAAEEIPDAADDPGYYTLEEEAPVAAIDLDDLPDVFHDVLDELEEAEEEAADTDTDDTEPKERTDSKSAVFDVEATDLVGNHDPGDRFASVFHGSSTSANMSPSNDKLHCWRHSVAHGGLQALATLSDVDHVRTYGCRDLGAAHKNSNAGSNSLKNDWRLIWGAWHEAKERREIAEDDPIPYKALRELAVADDLLDREDLVERDTDTGDVVEDPESHDGDTYEAFPAGAYADALEHVREEYGVDPGREVPEYDGDDTEADDEEHRTDPRRLDATVDPRRAWDAAGRVTPEDVDDDRLLATEDGEAFQTPAGDRVDVVRAVAIAEGLLEDTGGSLGDRYPEAYRLAREAYGAPLPEYYTTADAVAEFDALLDCIGEVTFWDLDAEALESEITEEGDAVGGDAVRALNPSWRESESEASVLVFESGAIWDADTERRLDAQRFVALDSGLLFHPDNPVKGDTFTEAYRRLREEYGAPLPRWDAADDGTRTHTPQLPPSEDLVADGDLDGVAPDALEAAREDVEALIGEAVTDTDDPTVVTSLPATGKTTGTVKTARDRPLSYLAPRKELQAQALEKADRWGVDAEILPVFSEERVREDVLAAAVSHVREHGTSRLRDRWAVLSAAFDDLDDEEADDTPDLGEIFTEDDEDDEEVDLERPTCETADGEHGVAWALAVHVARRLGYTPREIHTQARGLFGAPLPCSDGDDCRYTEGWDDVTDPDDPADLLVGSYVHAHVESVRTKYDRAADGSREKHPRAVVLDEFPGEAFTREFGPEALDFATWLATCLRDDVEDRRDMIDADLHGDAWVRAWLDGDTEDTAVEDTVDALARLGELYDAREEADRILGEVERDLLEDLGLFGPLRRIADTDAVADAFRDLRAAVGSVDRNHPAGGIARWADEEVADPLGKATLEGATTPTADAVDTEAVPFGGDLEAIVRDAVEAVEEDRDGAREAIAAAATALAGGREGCRRLAAWADDGYAHPDAHHLLRGVITPTDADSDDPGARRIDTDNWAFDPDATEGTTLDVVETTERARTVVDRNDHGALLHTPPSRKAGNGDDVALVGLDATGRRELWANAIGEEPTVADIHDTPAERAEFLLDALDLRVLQAADRPRSYEGDPTTKDTDGDVALLEAIDEEYSGLDAPRERGADPEPVGKPAAITTKGVRNVLEDDPRLDDVVAAWDNYGNVTGANDLGSHRLAAILGSQHYGDDAIERFCAIAGREVDTSREGGRGAALGYDDDLADAYLAHMRDDQTMQAILRFARGDSGATVVARTSALREDLPVVGDAQVVRTWSDTAAAVAREYRRLGERFTVADVADAVDVTKRQVRRVLDELVDAGYVRRLSSGDGVASTYEPAGTPAAGEVDLPERGDAVDAAGGAGRSPHNQYYTWNVRVHGGDRPRDTARGGSVALDTRAPPAPSSVDGVEPPS